MRPMDIHEPIAYPDGVMARIEREADETLRNMPSLLQTIFPRFEALLTRGIYQRALGFVADREAMSKYRHLADFALCELFPEYADVCAAYYDGEGEQLKERWEPSQMRNCEQAMLCLLAIARAICDDCYMPDTPCPVRWSTIVRTALEISRQAPPAPTPQ